MNELSALQKMYFIVDGQGRYYRIDETGNLVMAGSRDEADIFSYLEANRRIGGGRKSHFYSTIPIDYESDACEKTMEFIQPLEDGGKKPALESARTAFSEADSGEIADMKDINWLEMLDTLSQVIAGISAYRGILLNRVSTEDRKICDILHYIELYDAKSQASELLDKLQECREKRRIIKNEMYRVECFRDAIGSNETKKKIRSAIDMIRGREKAGYRPRELGDLFEDDRLKPRYIHETFNKGMERVEEKARELEGENGRMNETDDMEYEYKETVFDQRNADWMGFLKQQAEFYAEIPQYIRNLQSDIDLIDDEIEELLCKAEEANYNVTQGYRAFKEMKDLRNERKQKLDELQILRVMTEPFDCGAMAEVYQMIQKELMTDPEEEELCIVNPEAIAVS